MDMPVYSNNTLNLRGCQLTGTNQLAWSQAEVQRLFSRGFPGRIRRPGLARPE